MLYPKEDKQTTKLMFACRTCQYSEEAQSSCVFRNNMYNTVGETAGVTQDVGSDPTVCDLFPGCCSPDFSDSGLARCTLCGGEVGEGEEEMEMDSGEDAYLSETQYGPDAKVVPGSEIGSRRTRLTLAEMSHLEEEAEIGEEEEEDAEG